MKYVWRGVSFNSTVLSLMRWWTAAAAHQMHQYKRWGGRGIGAGTVRAAAAAWEHPEVQLAGVWEAPCWWVNERGKLSTLVQLILSVPRTHTSPIRCNCVKVEGLQKWEKSPLLAALLWKFPSLQRHSYVLPVSVLMSTPDRWVLLYPDCNIYIFIYLFIHSLVNGKAFSSTFHCTQKAILSPMHTNSDTPLAAAMQSDAIDMQ